MGITGNISTMSLADVFQWLHGGVKTGTLQIEDAGRKKEVYFQEGYICFASSNDPEESLGQFLITTQRITETQLTLALKSQKQDHNLLGKILVQQKVITEDELEQILRTISEEIIYDLFLWKEGVFEFKDDVLPNRDIPSLQLDITHLSLEGAQREDDWKRIKKTFPKLDAVVRPNIDKITAKLPLKPEQAQVLLHVDGSRNLNQINRKHRDTKYRTLCILLDLHEEGLLEIGSFSKQVLGANAHAKPKGDSSQEMLAALEESVKLGKLAEAENLILALEHLGVRTPRLVELKSMIKEKRNERTVVQIFNPNSVPFLKMDIGAITKMDLSAEQGFLVSRINGVWDVKSIVKVSPFGEKMCMDILKKFLNDGVIGFK